QLPACGVVSRPESAVRVAGDSIGARKVSHGVEEVVAGVNVRIGRGAAGHSRERVEIGHREALARRDVEGPLQSRTVIYQLGAVTIVEARSMARSAAYCAPDAVPDTFLVVAAKGDRYEELEEIVRIVVGADASVGAIVVADTGAGPAGL